MATVSLLSCQNARQQHKRVPFFPVIFEIFPQPTKATKVPWMHIMVTNYRRISANLKCVNSKNRFEADSQNPNNMHGHLRLTGPTHIIAI
jgi:hypothetical protein